MNSVCSVHSPLFSNIVFLFSAVFIANVEFLSISFSFYAYSAFPHLTIPAHSDSVFQAFILTLFSVHSAVILSVLLNSSF